MPTVPESYIIDLPDGTEQFNTTQNNLSGHYVDQFRYDDRVKYNRYSNIDTSRYNSRWDMNF